MQIPNEFFTVTSFGTLGGSTAAVFVITSGVGYFMSADKSLKYKKFISLALSFVCAFVAASLVSDKTWLTWLVAFVNGWLIFLTAVGVNSVAKSPVAITLGAPAAPAAKTLAPGATVTKPPIAHGRFRDPWY